MQSPMAIVGIFLCLFIHLTIVSAGDSKEETYNKTCNSDLQSGELFLTYSLDNFGCIVDCVIFTSSSKRQQEFLDRSERRRHLLSNIVCLNDSYICLNGSCVINPLKVHPEAVYINPLPGHHNPIRLPNAAVTGSANVTIHSGYVNRNDNLFNKGDTYVKVFVHEKKVHTSRVHYDTHYPEFEESFIVHSLSRMDIMKFELWDKNGRFSNDEYAGSITTSCDEVINKRMNGKRKPYFASANGDEARSNSIHRLHMTIQCRDF